MKIAIACYNYQLSSDLIIDGGSVWLNNLAQAFTKLGHDCSLASLDSEIEADLLICQSEWSETLAWSSFKGKKICLLGHFIKAAYPDPKEIKADLILTVWRGELLLEGFKTEFVPHAFNDCQETIKENKTEIIWLGNTYNLRKEDWLEGLEVKRLSGVHPDKLNQLYCGNVIPNIHAPCQMGEISTDPSAFADKSGTMLNERFWQAIGAGGILIQQYHPQVLDFFQEDEIIMCKTKQEFQEKCQYYKEHPEEGIKFYQRAREKVLKEHTYIHRAKHIIHLLQI